MMRGQIACVAVLGILALGAPPAENDDRASTPEKRIAWANSPDVLAGIKAVNLHHAIRGDVKNAKAGEQWLTTRVEKRLRQAGLNVITDEEAALEDVPVMLTLIIDLHGVSREASEGTAADADGVYLVRLMLDDVVVPVRDDRSVILGATTWSRRRFGHAGGKQLASKSMDEALKLVDEFCRQVHDAVRVPTDAPEQMKPDDPGR